MTNEHPLIQQIFTETVLCSMTISDSWDTGEKWNSLLLGFTFSYGWEKGRTLTYTFMVCQRVIWTNEKIKQSKRARDIDVIVHREQCRIWYWEETFPKINIDELLLMVILFSQSLLVMVYFMYQLDWTMGCPNRWWNIISKGVLSMFLEEIRLWMYRMSKADCTPLMWWASSISIEGLNQTKRKVKVKFVLWLTVELEYQFTPGFCSLGS